MNTAPDDSDEDCGDSLTHLAATGWKLAIPSDGYSWRWGEGSAGGADAGRRAAETIGLHRQMGASAPAHDEGPRPPAATPQIELFA